MAFQRAQWHSGLTYRQACRCCNRIVEYTDYNLDFRPWYADGFVYCPTCKTPLRHNENYAINKPDAQVQNGTTAVAEAAPANTEPASFCTNCGRKFNPGDRFCGGCGRKLV